MNPNKYFNAGMCDGAFLTKEYTYDAAILRDYLLQQIKKYPNVQIQCGVRIEEIVEVDTHFELKLKTGEMHSSGFLLNATYASSNQVLHTVISDGRDYQLKQHYEPFKIKYELCEIILCKVNKKLADVGITVMDGLFFSIMPFGKTGHHSLTAVTFTPHVTSFTALPQFECQTRSAGYCSLAQLGNCNICRVWPENT